MFGTFRFILALLVLFSHNIWLKYNVGVAAVICFFMISGYVMTALIRKSYGQLGKSTFYFYADRFLRIYPQYFLFMVLSAVIVMKWIYQPVYHEADATFFNVFLNALIVPINYYMFIPAISHYILIPAAWSLGLEEQFYWIFPYLVLKPWIGRIMTVISLCIFIPAILGYIHTEYFAFRFLPGVIFVFMLGKNLAEYNTMKSRESFWTLCFLYCAVLFLTIGCGLFKIELLTQAGFVTEILGGILIGFPILAFLSRQKRRQWDEFLGHSSYGIFLSHILVCNLIINLRLFEQNSFQFVTAAMVVSTLFGLAGYYLVEKMVNPFRFALRKRHERSMLSD